LVGADRTKLDQALARVRKGFKRDEILPGWHVEMVEEKAYSPDELGSMALLTLPAGGAEGTDGWPAQSRVGLRTERAGGGRHE
jgi:hypothetical protein